MTGNKKAILTKVCTFCMCFFSLFSLGTAAIAWFCNNKIVKNEGMSAQSELKDIHARFYVYKYSKAQNFSGTDLDESTPEHIAAGDKLTVNSFQLNTYDTIFVNENQYTPALIRIHFYGEDLPDASSSNPQDCMIRIKRDVSFVEVDDTIKNPFLYKCISNVANFTVAVPELSNSDYYSYISDQNNLNSISNINEFFNTTVIAFKNNLSTNPGITFFNSVETPSVKDDMITIPFQYTATKKITNSQTNNVENHLIVYLYVDYNLTLLGNFIDSENVNIDKEGLGQIDIQLKNDLSSIEVKVLDE